MKTICCYLIELNLVQFFLFFSATTCSFVNFTVKISSACKTQKRKITVNERTLIWKLQNHFEYLWKLKAVDFDCETKFAVTNGWKCFFFFERGKFSWKANQTQNRWEFFHLVRFYVSFIYFYSSACFHGDECSFFMSLPTVDYPTLHDLSWHWNSDNELPSYQTE